MSRFRILQFNMQFGQVWDDESPDTAPIRVEEALAEVQRHNADIITLQEVEKAAPNGQQVQPPPHYHRLQEALPGYDSYFSYPNADERELPFGIGLAIFSRTPLRESFRESIPSPPVEFDFFGETKTPTDRLLIGAKTTIDGRDVAIVTTHLLAFFMLKSSSEKHGEQRAQVGEHLRRADMPTLLTGDFNVSNKMSLVDEYAKFGFRSAQTEEITWRRKPFVLDHVFYNAPLRCVHHEVIPSPASDHHALVADFEFAK
ncbi:MAG: hypothetical protein SynsKO_08730 [Synoicihabitans sp.]